MSARGAAIGWRTGASLLLGQILPSPISNPLGWLATAATGIITILLSCRRDASRGERLLVGCSVILLIAASAFRARFTLNDWLSFGVGSRYFYGPQALLLWLLATLLVAGPGRLRMIGIGVMVLFLGTNLPRLREPALQDYRWRDYVQSLRAGEAVDIPVNPGWILALPARGSQHSAR